MIKIKLLGEMSELFIDEFMADVESCKDVIECISANFSDFKKYLLESAERGIGFVVKVGHQTIYKEELLSGKFDRKVKNFTLTPVPIGSGGGLGQVLLGVAFIGLGLLTGGAGFLGISSTSLYLIGGAMILKGVSSLFGGNKTGPTDKDNKKSLIFNGGAQTVTEGSRIPVCYGRHRVGLFVISSRVYSYFMGSTTATAPTVAPPVVTPPTPTPEDTGDAVTYYPFREM